MMKISDATSTGPVQPTEGSAALKGGRQQPPAGLELPIGKVVQAIVAEGGQDRVQLDIGGRRFMAETPTPLQTGQKIDVLVAETASKIILQVMPDTLQSRIANALYQLSGQWGDMSLVSKLAQPGVSSLPQLSPQAREGLLNWLTYLRDPAGQPFKGEELKNLPRALGLTMERDLAADKKGMTLKTALLDALSKLQGDEKQLARQSLTQLGERIGPASRAFQSLAPEAREILRNWFAARPEPTPGPSQSLKPGAPGGQIGTTPETGAPGRAPDTGAIALRQSDLQALANRLGIHLQPGPGVRETDPAAQFKAVLTEAAVTLQQGDKSSIADAAVKPLLGDKATLADTAVKLQQGDKTALAETNVRPQQGDQDLTRLVGRQIAQLAEGGAGAARQYAPESLPMLANWLNLVQNPAETRLNNNEAKFLAQLFGLSTPRDPGMTKPETAMQLLQQAAGQLLAGKEAIPKQLGQFLQQLADQGGSFLKQLPAETRQALHSVLTFLYQPTAQPPKSDDLRLLAFLFKFSLQPQDTTARQNPTELLKGALLDTMTRLQEGKGDMLHEVNRQLQQLELFQFSQIKLDQQNVYLLPLLLPFLEQGYLLAEHGAAGEEKPGDKAPMLSLYLSLQSLGDMQVDLLKNSEGLFLRFVMDSKEKADFMAGFLGELEEALVPFNLQSISFAIGAEKPATALIHRLVSEGDSALDTRI